nr:hypothetical protein Iba_chr14dCG6280 [Ipomoea batatas]
MPSTVTIWFPPHLIESEVDEAFSVHTEFFAKQTLRRSDLLLVIKVPTAHTEIYDLLAGIVPEI